MKVIEIIGLILLILPISSAAEEKSLFAILDEKYITNISELPFFQGNPDRVLQSSANINCWIDITGFRGMIREGDDFFINDLPDHAAIVQYDVSGSPPGYVDDLSKELTIYQDGANTIASLHVEMRWHKVQCDENSCWNVYFSNEATFQDIEESPRQYIPIGKQPEVKLTQYNTSVYENIGISIQAPEGLAALTVSYNDSSITHIKKIAHVETTGKGVYFANISNVDYWNVQGSNISHSGNMITMSGNLSKMDLNMLNITGNTLYESISADEYNLTRKEFTPEAEMQNPVLLVFISIVAVLSAGIYFSCRNMILRL